MFMALAWQAPRAVQGVAECQVWGWGRQHLQGWRDEGKDGGRGEVGKRESGTVSV